MELIILIRPALLIPYCHPKEIKQNDLADQNTLDIYTQILKMMKHSTFYLQYYPNILFEMNWTQFDSNPWAGSAEHSL